MFYTKQKESNKKKYLRLLNGAASLGVLNNSKSNIPVIDWRLAERIFCVSFDAQDIATQDVSIDSIKSNHGIGIKTFQGSPSQKIAEFNNYNKYIIPKVNDKIKIAQIISNYRNERLQKDINHFNLKDLIYHFTYRKKDASINIHEQKMKLINIDNIKLNNTKRDHIIKFNDGMQDYSYNTTKSTLFMRFNLREACESFIYKFDKNDMSYMIDNLYIPTTDKPIEKIRLSLYSERSGKVEEKSGLNQWNASGRERHHDEIYIPIPARIHKEYPDFFPSRDELFRLETDDGKVFLAKVCQSGRKALMSNPNKELGKWLLRDKLKVKPRILLDRSILKNKQIESIVITKYDIGNYQISI